MRKLLAVLAAAALLAAAPAPAKVAHSRAKAAAAKTPRLVVLLVVDQMPADALTRWRPYLRAGGLQELLKDGMFYQQAFYDHATTATGPGHSLIGSGQYGGVTGIVGNDWYDRKSGRDVYCVEDPSVKPSTPTARPMSPRNFEGVSLAERVKKRFPKSRVIGVSLKDRAAILTVGPKADAAYWYDAGARQFVSSDYYRYKTEPFSFNTRISEFARDREIWNYSISTAAANVCPEDRSIYHDDPVGMGLSFPHPIRDRAALTRSPFGDELLELFAERVISAYDLGRNPSGQPDVLAVSFSAYDYIGHAYGPDSCEIADETARLDTTLNRFLQRLQASVPNQDLLVAFTSDHGSAPIPELVRARGQDAGRVDLFNSTTTALSQFSDLRRRIEEIGAGTFSYSLNEEGPYLIASFQEPCLYLNPKGPARGREAQARAWLKGFLQAQPGFEDAATREELIAGTGPRSLELAFRADRSGDVCATLKSHWMWAGGHTGTNHGQPQPYDQHVPLIFWGDGVAAGDQFERVSQDQLAPTLAEFLGLSMKGFADPRPLPYVYPPALNTHVR